MLKFWRSLSFNFRLKLGRLVIAVRLEPDSVSARR